MEKVCKTKLKVREMDLLNKDALSDLFTEVGPSPVVFYFSKFHVSAHSVIAESN
ncbi:unnamed protein product [Schistocephalus solidus]|uniref:Uncharacterized protein n=1 Tax=Schistocephalus solidus TaxID=70667 RepID=A0A3P7C970_SCHSO|nr:unnamed protein product [Schistocephalus solidus]